VEREREMYRLHTVEGWTLNELARRYHVSRERVRQLLREYARERTGERPSSRAISRMAAQARRERNLALARAHAQQILASWRSGEEPKEIACAYELGRRCVEQVIREQAAHKDRAARAHARRLAKAGLGQEPSAKEAVKYVLERQPSTTAADLAVATGFSYGTVTVALRKLESAREATRTKGGFDQDGRRLRDRWTIRSSGPRGEVGQAVAPSAC
jgi:Mor family transcriptional regulator